MEQNKLQHSESQQPAQTSRPGRNGNLPPAQHRFQPGTSGNPGGRPRTSFSKILGKLVTANDQAYAKAFALATFEQACQGNSFAMKLVVRGIEGATDAELFKSELPDPEFPDSDFSAPVFAAPVFSANEVPDFDQIAATIDEHFPPKNRQTENIQNNNRQPNNRPTEQNRAEPHTSDNSP